ncbi:hypothetical protein EDB92DRAFT_80708 [Lactarius akahatsu]|uniref:Myb/SANT-like domain-containing protein n=1 Tax=Lactarius akahatsu TaxID=416441 RepID=A0AAD4LUS4_9AGAM|nr:hypothetical protein EDB92DRAFT_80708 [Lactarius akahatsu]
MAYAGPAEWSRVDEATLVRTLIEEKVRGNWNGNLPKAAAWAACQLALVDSEKTSGGGAKTIESIKNKWQRFKNEFYAVKDLQAVSGFRWNDQEKIVTAPADVWDAYIKTHPHANKLRRRRFLLYDTIAYLVNDTGPRATGGNAVRPGQNSRDYSSSEDDELATPGPLPSNRKRSKEACTSASQRKKIRRVSFDQEMSEVVSAFAEMIDAMKSRLVSMPRPEPPKPSTDDLLTRAIIALEQDAGLSDKALAEAAYCFLVDRDVARVYVTLQTPRARSHFLRQLETRRRKL